MHMISHDTMRYLIDYFESSLLKERERIKRENPTDDRLVGIAENLQKCEKARTTFDLHPSNCEGSQEEGLGSE